MVGIKGEGRWSGGLPPWCPWNPQFRSSSYVAKTPSILGEKWRVKAGEEFPGGGSMKLVEK